MSAVEGPENLSTVHLRAGQFLHCAQEQPVWLSVVRGRVWVTHARDPDDHFLDAGQSIRLPAGALALVGAESAAQVTLVEDDRVHGGSRAHRGSRWMALGATIRASPP